MTIIKRIGFCVIYHPFEENANKAPEIFKNSINLLRSSLNNFEIIEANELIQDVPSAISVGIQFKQADVDVICVKLATWSSDNPILDMSSYCDVPFIFWSYPHMHAGSLCGGQQFNMVFKELGKECIFVYKEDKKALEKINNYSICVALRNNLQKARFLQIGNRTQGMAEVNYDEFSIKEVFGARIIGFGLDTFKELANEFTNEEAMILWQDFTKDIKNILISEHEGIKAMKNYLAMKSLIENGQISGVTIECYPRYMGQVCLGFSMLADEGIPGACESDINSLIVMYILTKLSGSPVHSIDPLFLYEEDNNLLGSHCGCGSKSLADNYNHISLENVRLAKEGACILFPSKTGLITMVNLVGRKGTYRMAVIEAEAIETKMLFPGNPSKIKLPIDSNDFLDTIEEFGLGHHWIIAYGHYADILRRLTSLLAIDFINI
ncbi:MAG: hypothetical protein ACTSR8_21395 [Promethearchaeota archaeon]